MRYYQSGDWGFSLVWGLEASVFPRAICLAVPNAIISFFIAELYIKPENEDSFDEDTTKNAISMLSAFTSVLFFVLYFRSNIAYDRWWEGGTLLQKTRGEWFNAYSSLMAFTSTDPDKEKEVEEFQHLLARLMSLLFCCGLQQVSPNKERPFEIIDTYGIDPKSMQFLNQSQDKVEVILQWIQRNTVLHMQTGVLPVAPPVLSRAFQEVSRGIVNLQNARKIADFPFPFPFAQTSMVMLLIHWVATPVLCAQMMAVAGGEWHAFLAAGLSFCVIFFIWCINYIALQLEMPFGTQANDLPMTLMQKDWNKSIGTLLAPRAKNPPEFFYEEPLHRKLELAMSDGSTAHKKRITLPEAHTSLHTSEFMEKSTMSRFSNAVAASLSIAASQISHRTTGANNDESPDLFGSDSGHAAVSESGPIAKQISEEATASSSTKPRLVGQGSRGVLSDISEQGETGERERRGTDESRELFEGSRALHQFKTPEDRESFGLVRAAPSVLSGSVILDMRGGPQAKDQQASGRTDLRRKSSEEPQREEKLLPPLFPNPHVVDAAGFDTQLRMVGVRMKELHACLIDEELNLLSALGTRLASTETPVDKPRPGDSTAASIGI